MAATNSAFRTETRDEHLYNHIELFNRSSSPIDAPAANRCQDCRGQHPTENQIATGRRMLGDYRTEPSNEHLYYNIQSINKSSSSATESQGANQTSQDDRRRQQPTGNSKTMGRRVASAMIAVLALTFLAVIASLIATKWLHAENSGTKNGIFLDRYNWLLVAVDGLKFEIGVELWLATAVLRRIWLIFDIYSWNGVPNTVLIVLGANSLNFNLKDFEESLRGRHWWMKEFT